jgi:transposase-like protein
MTTQKQAHMARPDQFRMSVQERRLRTFSEDFKREKVKELDRNLLTISELCNEYQVSRTSVYRWKEKYSKHYTKGVRMIMEKDSDTRKITELKAKIKELERIIGQKQLQIDFQAKMMEIAEKDHGVEFKKKQPGKPSSGTGSTGKSTK